MGDRTNAQITVYACPPEQVQAVLGIIENYLGYNDWGDYDGRSGVLHLGGCFGAHEVSCGSSDEIAKQMIQDAPGAAFIVNEDPYADWLGSVNVYTPELGWYSAECDANGQPMFGVGEVRKISRLSAKDREIALGTPWLEKDALDKLLPPADQRLVPVLPDCSRCGGEWGEDLTCQKCVDILALKDLPKDRKVIDPIQDTGLAYVVTRPTVLVFECPTCTRAEREHLGTRTVEVRTPGYWPTEAEAHTAHHGFAKGLGRHNAEAFEIKEVLV